MIVFLLHTGWETWISFGFAQDKLLIQGPNVSPMLTPMVSGVEPLKTSRMAERLGFEPRLADSESAVLPLDDLSTSKAIKARIFYHPICC